MIALDSSSLIAYFSGARGKDVERVDEALDRKHGCLPPVVLAELLSDPNIPRVVVDCLRDLPGLAVLPGYWERAGFMRSRLLGRGHKAPLADTLVAQSCLDHKVPLVTRDRDFHAFARFESLGLV